MDIAPTNTINIRIYKRDKRGKRCYELFLYTDHSIIFNLRNKGCSSCISGGGAGHPLIRRKQTAPPVPPHSFIFSMISFGSAFKYKKGRKGARSETHTHFWEKSGFDKHEVSSAPLFWWLLSGAMKGIFVLDEAADK